MNKVVEYYQNCNEEERLTTNNSRKIEYVTTKKIFNEVFPKKAKILDCAAGTGVYAFYLAENGYDVTATDIAPRHIEYINKNLKDKTYTISTHILDATDLSKFKDNSFDIVLNMGPFYHLTQQKMRDKCLKESVRVLKKGGLLVTAYISKFFIFPCVAISDQKYLNADLANKLILSGTLEHDDPNCFWTDTYFSSPNQMESYFRDNKLNVIEHFAQDGVAPMLKEQVDNWNKEQFDIWCNYHYSTCREKSIMGLSNHCLIIGKK